VSLHNRKLKVITLDIGGTNRECQISNWQLNNNSEDGEKLYSYCPDGEAVEETDPDYSLDLTFFSDWTSGGISDWFVLHDGETVTFQLDHHPDIVGEHVRYNGSLVVKAPNVGGEIKTTETQEITLQCVGKPAYSRP